MLVETTNITGHGDINVNGGDAQSNGGGGAGGRIGIHVDFQNNFGGTYWHAYFFLPARWGIKCGHLGNVT